VPVGLGECRGGQALHLGGLDIGHHRRLLAYGAANGHPCAARPGIGDHEQQRARPAPLAGVPELAYVFRPWASLRAGQRDLQGVVT